MVALSNFVLHGLGGRPGPAGSPHDDPLRWPIRGSLSYRADGTSFRTSRMIRADHGGVLTDVARVKPGQLSLKYHLGGGYTDPLTAPVTVPGGDSPAYRQAVVAAAAQAIGHVDAEDARGLLDGTAGYLGTTGDRMNYRFWWGQRLGHSTDALVATLRGPAGPTLRVVQVTYTADQSTEQDRFAVRMRSAADTRQPIGWTTTVGQNASQGEEHATGAVYVPGRPGVRVELWDRGAILMAGNTGATGLAVFPTRLSKPALRACEYRVVNGKGHATYRGLNDLYVAGAQEPSTLWMGKRKRNGIRSCHPLDTCHPLGICP